MKIVFEIDNDLYRLAQKWFEIERKYPVPDRFSETKEGIQAYDRQMIVWEKYLIEKNLIILSKTKKYFMGKRIDDGYKKTKQCDDFLNILKIIRLKEKEK